MFDKILDEILSIRKEYCPYEIVGNREEYLCENCALSGYTSMLPCSFEHIADSLKELEAALVDLKKRKTAGDKCEEIKSFGSMNDSEIAEKLYVNPHVFYQRDIKELRFKYFQLIRLEKLESEKNG